MTRPLHRFAAWLHVRTAWATRLAVPKPSLCRLEASTRLLPTAAIINNRKDPDCIRLGEWTVIKGELLTFGHGGDIQIGNHCFVGENTRIWSALSIRIGDRVLISHNVNVFDNDTHPIDDAVTRHNQYMEIITTGQPKSVDLNERAVVIEDDALIGCQCIILPGVTIGRGGVVGAGSVVTKDVPPYTVVAGNPARVIRTIDRKGGE